MGWIKTETARKNPEEADAGPDWQEWLQTEKAIQDAMESGFHGLTFSGGLETRYREMDLRHRKKYFPPVGWTALILFLFYCIPDRFMVPDIYRAAWCIRIFGITPICVAVLFAIPHPRVTRSLDLLISLALLLGSLVVIVLVLLSDAPQAHFYHTGLLPIMVFITIVARLRFRISLVLCSVIFLCYAAALPLIPALHFFVKINNLLVLFSTLILCLIGAYHIEYQRRRDYLEKELKRIDSLRLESANRELTALSLSDPLTGLANRRHFDETLARHWRKTARSGDTLSLIFIDIDCFKAYNDNYGHQAGDYCIRKVADTLKHHTRRPFDLAARFGGEEFVLLLPHTSGENATRLAERIRHRVEDLRLPHAFSDVADHLSVSLGVAATIPEPDADPAALVAAADAALYGAKQEGKNRVKKA